MKRPKFRKGQIVVVRHTSQPFKIDPIAGYCNIHNRCYKLLNYPADTCWDENELRPLTKREQGLCRFCQEPR